MKTRRRWTRALLPTLPALLALSLAGAAWLPAAQQLPQEFEPAQFRVNEERWLSLPDGRRQELRRRWSEFSVQTEADRELALQRMTLLRRVTATLRRVQGGEPAPADIEQRLNEIHADMISWLRKTLNLPADASRGTLHDQLDDQMKRRIRNYVAGLPGGVHLDEQQREELLLQPLSLMLRDAVALRAMELALLSAEGVTPQADAARARDAQDLWQILQEAEAEAADKGAASRADPPRRPANGMEFLPPALRALGLSHSDIKKLFELPESERDARLRELFGLH